MDKDIVVVTDDSTEEYNCLGFCFAVRAFLQWPMEELGAPYLERCGYQRYPQPHSENEIVIAMYEGPRGPHVAKRLRCDWYESKCGPGLRIVHRLRALENYYGSKISYWLLADEQARLAALAQAEAQAAQFGAPPFVPIEDSLAIFGEQLLRAMDCAHRGATNF